jgi:hypothetical protein
MYEDMITKLEGAFYETKRSSPNFTLSTLYAGLSTIAYQVSNPNYGNNSQLTAHALISMNTIFNGYFISGSFPPTLLSSDLDISRSCVQVLPRKYIGSNVVANIVYQDYTRPHSSVNTGSPQTVYTDYKCDLILDPQQLSAPMAYGNGAVDLTLSATVTSAGGLQSAETISAKLAQTSDMSLNVNMVSVMIAYAINIGFLPLANLSAVPSSDALTVPLQAYSFSRYPEMDVIFCQKGAIVGPSAVLPMMPLCYVRVNANAGLFTIALPTMASIASAPQNSQFFLGPCDCQVLHKMQNKNLTAMCGQPNFLFSLFGLSGSRGPSQTPGQYWASYIHNTTSIVNSAGATAKSSQAVRYVTFSNYVFNVSISQLTQPNTFNMSRQPTAEDKARYKELFSFCDGTCYVMPLWFFGLTTGMSPNSFSLSRAICAEAESPNNVFPSEVAWAKLKKNPPTALNYGYYKCRNTVFGAAQQAIGIANGINIAVTTVSGFILLPLFVFLMQKCGFLFIPSDGFRYPPEDTQLAVNELALQILRIRDGEPVKSSGPVESLALDLLNIARFSAKAHERSASRGDARGGDGAEFTSTGGSYVAGAFTDNHVRNSDDTEIESRGASVFLETRRVDLGQSLIPASAVSEAETKAARMILNPMINEENSRL